ncbi:MAG: class I SAM-dependent methyltransferase [Spirochaetota bacterium]|nr:MAG: class I SAM-dependent methyltransferase [Spirochaetota bacterium]
MNNRTKKSVANSLEVENKLLPYMPYLLQDLWALGSSINQILDIVVTLPLSSDTAYVLDLGCGKGAVSVQIASEFGYSVVGIDAMPEFLQEAQIKAAEYHVSELCTFYEQDILTYVKDKHDFNIVILASLGGIFGSNKDTIKTLRTQVKPGGYVVIDDGYLKKRESLNRKGYGHYRNYEKTVEDLTSFSDCLISEISTTEVSKKINDEYLHVIESRIIELSDQHPELEKDLNNYLELQREECDILNKELEGMIWVLKKSKK